MSEDRLQKILARAGVVSSRRKAEELIQEGRVTVNGRMAEIGEKADPAKDAIKLDGKRIQPVQEHRYLLLNKPKGYMSTISDPEGRPTVIDLVPPAMRKALVPVGRLDFHTEGLLLLTDDGEFAQRVAHPRYGSVKTYEVKVKGTPGEHQLDRLRSGIFLDDGRRTAPVKITSRAPFKPAGARRRGEPESENSWWIVELAEGRSRQIREMFFRIGNPVQKLRRIAIGPLRDSRLPLGTLRDLTEQEIQKLLKASRKPAEKKPGRKKTAPKTAGAKTAGTKTAGAKTAGTKTTGAKAAGAKTAPAKKSAARKAPPRRPAVKPSEIKRAGAKRNGAKKARPGRAATKQGRR